MTELFGLGLFSLGLGLFGLVFGLWLIMPRVTHERPRHRMVPASTSVQVPKQGSAYLGSDTSLEDT